MLNNPFNVRTEEDKYYQFIDIYKETEILYKGEEELLTRKRVCEILNYHESTVRRKEESGELETIKLGRSMQSGIRIKKSSLIRYVAKCEVESL